MRTRKDIAVSVIMSIMLSAALLGCGSTSTPSSTAPETTSTATPTATTTTTTTTTTSEQEPSTTEAEQTALRIGDTATLNDWEITLDEHTLADSIAADYGSFSPDDGDLYVVVNLSVKNLGTVAGRFLPSYPIQNKDVRAKLLYQDTYEFVATTLFGQGDDLHDSTINPLSTQSGVIAFSVAAETAQSGELTLEISSGDTSILFALSE